MRIKDKCITFSYNWILVFKKLDYIIKFFFINTKPKFYLKLILTENTIHLTKKAALLRQLFLKDKILLFGYIKFS